MTAFLRPDPSMEAALVEAGPGRGGPPGSPPRAIHRRAILELYDPLTATDIDVAGSRVSLENDLSTPLAYFLSQINLDNLAYAGLLRPDLLLNPMPNASRPIMGLYMVQPYQPGKIPVILVHGLWSSPMTWMQMFNDLRACPEVRDHYQFWFYLYPTAQPFWISAARFREDLAEMRQVFDPEHREPALDQMVLVGHSMGGLLSRMQTLDSRDDYWTAVSHQPLEQLKAGRRPRAPPGDVLFPAQPVGPPRDHDCHAAPRQPHFQRNHAVAGGQGDPPAADSSPRPAGPVPRQPRVLPGRFAGADRDEHRLAVPRVAGLPDHAREPAGPLGDVPQYHRRGAAYHGLLGKLTANSDGVVTVDSARIGGVASEPAVTADHSGVNSHPLAVLEVRRILLEHLAQLRGQPSSPPPTPLPPAVAQYPLVPEPPAVAQSPTAAPMPR